VVSTGNPEKRAEAITAEAERRAAIDQRRRLEWEEHRRHLKHAIDEADFESAKLAKITAETLQICQAGERRAWSLDSSQTKPDVSISAEIRVQALDDVELERIAARGFGSEGGRGAPGTEKGTTKPDRVYPLPDAGIPGGTATGADCRQA
jgi:hypothetical protein